MLVVFVFVYFLGGGCNEQCSRGIPAWRPETHPRLASPPGRPPRGTNFVPAAPPGRIGPIGGYMGARKYPGFGAVYPNHPKSRVFPLGFPLNHRKSGVLAHGGQPPESLGEHLFP